MVITRGSTFNFQIQFEVPTNNKFFSIVLSDTFPNGLSYTINSATITSTLSPTTPLAYTDNSEPYIDSDTKQELSFLITTPAEIQPLATNVITAKLPVTVVDPDALLTEQARVRSLLLPDDNVFQNIATISAYTSVDGTGDPISTLNAANPLDFTDCSIYGLGIGTEVSLDAGKDVHLAFGVTNISSADNAALTYRTTITVPAALDLVFDATDPTSINDSVTAFFRTSDNIIENLVDTVTFVENLDGTKTVTITYSHQAQFSGEVLYIDLLTRTNILLEENPLTTEIFVLAVTELLYNADINCATPLYYANVSIVAPEPVLSEATKSLVLS